MTALAFVVAGLPFTWVLTLLLGPYVVIAGGLLAVGLWQRYRPLAVAGAVFGVLGVAEGLFWISNRLPTSVWRGWAHPAIFLAIAVAMVGTGLVALVREIRAAR